MMLLLLLLNWDDRISSRAHPLVSWIVVQRGIAAEEARIFDLNATTIVCAGLDNDLRLLLLWCLLLENWWRQTLLLNDLRLLLLLLLERISRASPLVSWIVVQRRIAAEELRALDLNATTIV